jgi:hypothetical protein
MIIHVSIVDYIQLVNHDAIIVRKLSMSQTERPKTIICPKCQNIMNWNWRLSNCAIDEYYYCPICYHTIDDYEYDLMVELQIMNGIKNTYKEYLQ